MNPRLQVLLPAILTFVFGVGFGIVIGWIAWAGQQPVPHAGAEPPSAGMEGQPSGGEQASRAGGQEARSADEDPKVLRQRLELHQQLLAKNPEDVRLLRTVGNYQGLLGQNEEALTTYAKAEALARQKGETTQLVEILTDEGVALAETGKLDPAFAKLDEAEKLAPKDTRSRLTAAVVLMTRVMPSPPPGWDRKQAVTKAQALLEEVLAIEPNEPNALEMLSMIQSVRGSMARGVMPRGGEAPAPDAGAPATPAEPGPGPSGGR